MIDPYFELKKEFALAITKGEIGKLKEMVASCSSIVNEKHLDIWPLQLAIITGKPAVFRYLLEDAHASLDIMANTERGPLLARAVAARQPEIVKTILSNDKSQIHHKHLLSCALSGGDIDTARHLIDYGCILRPQDLCAAAAGGLSALELLLPQMKDHINTVDDEGNTPLMIASHHDHTDAVQFLIGNGADVNFANQNGLSAINAFQTGTKISAATVKVLLGAQADIHQTDGDKLSILHRLVISLPDAAIETAERRIEILDALIGRGADIEARCPAGQTPLTFGITRMMEQYASLLIQKGANTNTRDDHQSTPFMRAAANCMWECMNDLMQHGADPTLTDLDRKSARDYGQDGVTVALCDLACKKWNDDVRQRSFERAQKMINCGSDDQIRVLPRIRIQKPSP